MPEWVATPVKFNHSNLDYRSGAKHLATLIIAPANTFVLNDVFSCSIVSLNAAGRF
jgi:hypothetical protein